MKTLYKAFDKNTTCRGFKYPTDGSWVEPMNNVLICSQGYHACGRLEHVFSFYPTPDSIWEIEGKVRKADWDKVVCSTIRLVKKIEFKDIPYEVISRIGDTSVGYLWQHLTKEVKIKIMNDDRRVRSTLCRYMVINDTEEEFEFYAEHASNPSVKQEPWFYEKLKEKHPEHIYKFVHMEPKLMERWQDIIPMMKPDGIVDFYINHKTLPKKIFSEALMKLSDGDWPVVYDVLKSKCTLNQREVKHLFKIFGGDFYRVANNLKPQYISVLIKEAQKMVDGGDLRPAEFIPNLKLDNGIIKAASLKITGFALSYVYRALHRCSPRARTIFMLKRGIPSLPIHSQLLWAGFEFDTEEEVEAFYKSVPRKMQYDSYVRQVVRSPLCPMKIVRMVAKSKRWYNAAAAASERIKNEEAIQGI